MYRHLALVLAVVFCAACSHSEGIGMGKNYNVDPVVDPVVDAIPFKQLTIQWNGAVPFKIVKSVSVTADHAIAVRIIQDKGSQSEVTKCSGSVTLEAAVYQSILDYVNAADLANYEPPAEGGPTCKVPGQGWILQVVYVQADDTENQFSTGTCEIEDVIDSLATVVADAAKDAVPDCTAETLQPADETPAATE